MSTKYHDYYKTLGVERTASAEEIQRAYRALARKLHPDINKEPGAEVRFKEVTEAYEVLKDPKKRQRYDALGSNWKAGDDFRGGQSAEGGGAGGGRRVHVDFGRGGGGEDFSGFSDFFESLFGGGAGGMGGGFDPDAFRRGAGAAGTRANRAPRPHAGADHEAEVTVSLLDAIKGGTRQIKLASEGAEDVRSYDVRIPPGVTDGSTIRLSGQGSPGHAGGPPGDLLLRIRLAPDPRFRVEHPGGHDLVTDLLLAPWEAALGAKIDVPTPEGEVRMTIPTGAQSGQRMRIRGHGLSKRSGERGDLFAELRIVVPRTLTPRQREAFERLASESEWNPRRE